MKVKLVILVLALISAVMGQVSILGPSELTSLMKNYESTDKLGLDHSLGNFGEIPYGKSSVGYVYYQPNSDGTNSWCNFDNTSVPQDLENLTNNEYTSIFLVDYTKDCSLTKKAYNVQSRGGRIMLLISDDKSFKDHHNVDDKLGDRVNIATVILRKSEGDEIKNFIKNNPKNKVVMSIKYTSAKSSEPLKFDIYLRSDDPKSLHFFKEFKQYFDLLKNKWIFTPYYKYYRYSWESSSNVANSKEESACIQEGKYCEHDNPAMKIYNPRLVLIQNIKQSCIYSLYKDNNLEFYWDYMIKFSDTCMDMYNPLFTDECSEQIMKISGVDPDLIQNCVENTIKTPINSVARDYQAFIDKKVHKIPEIQLNNVKYRGNWHANHVFDAICSGFIDDQEICGTPSPQEAKAENTGFGVGAIFLIALSIFLALIIILICYRRIVNLSLEATINEKIQSQAMHSIGQYEVFRDEKTGRKTVDVEKL